MKMKVRLVAALAALAGIFTGGCTTSQPVYVAPPPTGGVTIAPGPTTAPPPAPGTLQEPPPGSTVVGSQPPPTPPTEVAPAAPGPDYVWTTGYYNWNGVAWVWIPGVWVVPPYRGALWFGGHWHYGGGRAVWVRGRWR
ncbi:MAG TPA: hypothetical protein VGR14_09930 [Verrucomicrobiae bacterium]|nr:hypothetical protein [Verrucomicrobiae bacterium]